MSTSIFLTFVALLLVTVPQCTSQRLVSCHNEISPCDRSILSSVEEINITRFEGKWYKVGMSSALPRYAGHTGNVIECTIETDDQGNALWKVEMTMSFTGNKDCVSKSFRCRQNGTRPTCSVIGIDEVFTVVAIEYESVLALWAEAMEGGHCYTILNIYVRDPRAQPDLSPIQSAVQQFCSAQATDLASDFYPVRYSYADVPSCMTT